MGDAKEAGRVGVRRRKGCRGAGMPKMKAKSQRGRKEEEEEEEEEGGHGSEEGHGGGRGEPSNRWSAVVNKCQDDCTAWAVRNPLTATGSQISGLKSAPQAHKQYFFRSSNNIFSGPQLVYFSLLV